MTKYIGELVDGGGWGLGIVIDSYTSNNVYYTVYFFGSENSADRWRADVKASWVEENLLKKQIKKL